MFATVFNGAAVIIGAVIGIFIAGKIQDDIRDAILQGAGITTLVIGVAMCLETSKILYLALALIIGGVLGTWWGIDAGILNLGHYLERLTMRRSQKKEGIEGAKGREGIEINPNGWDFGRGFLNASVLFCVGPMAIVGSFEAGTGGGYMTLLIKSILDGSMAIIFAAALGPGVAFSALSIIVYQGLLTLGAQAISPWVSPLLLAEMKGLGGALILMIAINILELRSIKTANFLPALILMVIFIFLDPYFYKFAGLLGIG